MFIVKPDRVTIIDSVAGHRKTLDTLTAFLASDQPVLEIASAGACHLCPGWPPLHALRFVKSTEKFKVEETGDSVLQVAGRPDLLAIYAQAFAFKSEEHGHHHPEYHDALMEQWDRTSIRSSSR